MRSETHLESIAIYLVVVILCLASIANADVLYNVIDLGPGYASSINDLSQVAGYGFIWSESSGRQETGMGWTYINDKGDVAGAYDPPDTDSRPCLWNPIGGIRDIGEPGFRGWGSGINNSNQVVGWYGPSNGVNLYAFIWQEDTGLNLIEGPFSGKGSSSASDLNNKGQVAINAFNQGSYLWDSINDNFTYIGAHRARRINEFGQVVFDDFSAIWSQGSGFIDIPIPLGYTQGHGRGLNDMGQVVGICYKNGWNGFVWDEHNGTRLLKNLIDPSQGWLIEYADGINNKGEIVGSALLNGESHAVLLVPIPEPPVCSESIPSDLNGDCKVDFEDFAIFADQWLLEKLSADVAPGTGDGIVNFIDYAVFADGWQSVNDMNELADFVSQWLKSGAYSADIAPVGSSDGIVNMLDFAVFAGNWLECNLDPPSACW